MQRVLFLARGEVLEEAPLVAQGAVLRLAGATYRSLPPSENSLLIYSKRVSEWSRALEPRERAGAGDWEQGGRCNRGAQSSATNVAGWGLAPHGGIRVCCTGRPSPPVAVLEEEEEEEEKELGWGQPGQAVRGRRLGALGATAPEAAGVKGTQGSFTAAQDVIEKTGWHHRPLLVKELSCSHPTG